MINDNNSIYTDGSCISIKDKTKSAGAWVAIVLTDKDKFLLKGTVFQTTHQRMELTAAIKAMEFINTFPNQNQKFTLYTDSQYVAQLINRKDVLVKSEFITGKGILIHNADLLIRFFDCMEKNLIEFKKVKSHQKKTLHHNYNREADLLCRKMARETFNEMNPL